MLKYIAALSLAALLSLSPAFADPGGSSCVPQKAWLERIPAKPIARLTADDAKDFVKDVNEFAAANPDTSKALPPFDYNEIILWVGAEDTVIFALFVKDCSVGYGRMGIDAVAAMSRSKHHPAPKGDDGTL